jgi:hypothetical protein
MCGGLVVVLLAWVLLRRHGGMRGRCGRACLQPCGSAGELACCCGVRVVVGRVVRPLQHPSLSRFLPAVWWLGGAPQRRGVAGPAWVGVAAVRGGMAHRTQPRSRVAGCLARCSGTAASLLGCATHCLRVCVRPNSGPATGHRGRRRRGWGGGRLMAATSCRQPRRCVVGHRFRQRVSGRVWGARGARAMHHSLSGAPT